MLRASTPIQLSQLDINPAIQAGALEQQAAVNLNNTLQTSILEFAKKQEEKRVKKERDLQIDQFLPGLMSTVVGEDVSVENPKEYKAFSDFFKKNYGDDILAGLKSIQDLMPETPDLSAKEKYEKFLRENTDLSNTVISDIANDKLLPTKDARGNPTNIFRSSTSGQLIDLTNPNQPTEVTSDIPVETSSETDAVDTPPLQFSFPEYIDPDMQKQGLYGQAKTLEERQDFYTGIVSSVKEGVENTLSAQNSI